MYFTFYIDVMRLSIFIFPYRYDVVQNMKSFLGKKLVFFFNLHTRGAWRNQTKMAGKMDGMRFLEASRNCGEKMCHPNAIVSLLFTVACDAGNAI